jgi:hypothetical protein
LCWNKHLWRRWFVFQRSVWPHSVIVATPALDDDLSLAERVEDFPVEQLVSETGIKALDVAVLPRRARCDVGRLRTDRCNTGLHGLGYELRSIVRPNVSRHTAFDEQIGKHVGDVDRFQLTPNSDG